MNLRYSINIVVEHSVKFFSERFAMLIRDYVDAFIPHRIELNCAYCYKSFLWFCSDMNENSAYNRPKYCSDNHRKKAKARRAKARTRSEGRGVVCPHPAKRKFASNEEALMVLTSNHYGDDQIAPYLCKCGFFHNGHSRKKNRQMAVA